MKNRTIKYAWVLSFILLCSCSVENNNNSSLMKIEECRTDYANVSADSKKNTYKHLDFQNAKYELLPEFESVGVYSISYSDISVEESINVVQNWLKDNGFTVDLEHELFAATGQFEGEGDNPYPRVMPHIDELDNGNGFFIDNNICHIQMGGANIYSMSNGKITAYVHSEEKAGLDAMGIYAENVINEGFVEELSDYSYELMDGHVSIGEAAKTVKSYFENGTPYFGPPGTEIDVPYVKVYSIGDIYGYVFNVRRVYRGVPFAYGDFGTYREEEDQLITLDIKLAYTISGSVDAYTGYSNNCTFIPIEDNRKEIIPLSQALEMLDGYVGAQMKIAISKVALEYCVITKESTNTETVYPCWSFEGINSSDGRTYVFYVDVLNGTVFYHSFVEQ